MAKVTKSAVEKLLDLVENDTWCGECGLHGTATGLYDFLTDLGREVPYWINEIINRMGRWTKDA